MVSLKFFYNAHVGLLNLSRAVILMAKSLKIVTVLNFEVLSHLLISSP